MSSLERICETGRELVKTIQELEKTKKVLRDTRDELARTEKKLSASMETEQENTRLMKLYEDFIVRGDYGSFCHGCDEVFNTDEISYDPDIDGEGFCQECFQGFIANGEIVVCEGCTENVWGDECDGKQFCKSCCSEDSDEDKEEIVKQMCERHGVTREKFEELVATTDCKY